MKRILTVQDISCVGKCSLSVALPIISALGVECAVLPTAVLSTHTAFKNFTIRDLGGDMNGIIDVWKKENLTFDAVYTGYIASADQLETIGKFCASADGAHIYVDPVMGDFGRLYAGFDKSFPIEMKKLCDSAHVILPNLTEAFALLGEDYTLDVSGEKLRDMLKRLCDGGARVAVLTGYEPRADRSGVLKYDSRDGSFFEYTREKIASPFPLHGTGDIFASVCVGAAEKGRELDEALALAVDFTADCIQHTVNDPERRWYGMSFEAVLPNLCRAADK